MTRKVHPEIIEVKGYQTINFPFPCCQVISADWTLTFWLSSYTCEAAFGTSIWSVSLLWFPKAMASCVCMCVHLCAYIVCTHTVLDTFMFIHAYICMCAYTHTPIITYIYTYSLNNLHSWFEIVDGKSVLCNFSSFLVNKFRIKNTWNNGSITLGYYSLDIGRKI